MSETFPAPRKRYSVEATDPDTGEDLRFSLSCEKEPSAELVEALKAVAVAAVRGTRDGTIQDEPIYSND